MGLKGTFPLEVVQQLIKEIVGKYLSFVEKFLGSKLNVRKNGPSMKREFFHAVFTLFEFPSVFH